jgi:hypothetical protein
MKLPKLTGSHRVKVLFAIYARSMLDRSYGKVPTDGVSRRSEKPYSRPQAHGFNLKCSMCTFALRILTMSVDAFP